MDEEHHSATMKVSVLPKYVVWTCFRQFPEISEVALELPMVYVYTRALILFFVFVKKQNYFTI